MSRAFVKEADGEAFTEDLPDRPVSPERNLVTAAGLASIESALAEARHRLAEAQKAADRDAIAHASRDLRYWSQRHATAELVPAPEDHDEVRFGHRVTIERDGGKRQSYRITGLDEAEPAKGLISYVSPLARAMLGKRIGDVVKAGAGEAEIIAIVP